MYLTYYTDEPNFGDALNPVLAAKVFGDVFTEDRTTRVLFIGTIIERSPPPGTRELIVGAGAGYKRGPYQTANREIFCVRGPYTCDLLGIGREYAAIDPAILAARYFTGSTGSGPAFMPHSSSHAMAAHVLSPMCRQLGISYISPLDEPARVMAQIAGASCLLTEALHGAVVAESYEVPWQPVVFSSKVLVKKWLDFTATIGADYSPADISTNIAFDGNVRFLNVIKYATAKAGLGKQKYRYLPVRKATDAALGRLERDLSRLKSGAFVTADRAAKAASIARLDAALLRFRSALSAAAAKPRPAPSGAAR